MRNYPEWVIAFAAITSIGAVSVSLNAWWTEDELDFALEDCGAKVLRRRRRAGRAGPPSAARLGCRILAVRHRRRPAADGVDRWEDVVVPGAPMPDVAVGPDDDATILYTSGTTGRPKGAVSTHRAILQALMGFGCRAAIDRLRRPGAGPRPEPRRLPPVVHPHRAAVPRDRLRAGDAVVLRLGPEAGDHAQVGPRAGPGADRAGEGHQLRRRAHPELGPARVARASPSTTRRRLLSIGGGGAPAPPELVKRVAASFRKGRPQIGYGMTETNAYGPGNTGQRLRRPTPPAPARSTPDPAARDPRPRRPRRCRSASAARSGMKGPNLIRGYWNRPEATAETIVDGWLRTGDLGRLDDEGFVYIEDRAKDMILRAGENVYSAEVEAAIYEHPAVYEAAVFGVPHERLGEEVAAAPWCVRAGDTLTVEELQAHVARAPGRLQGAQPWCTSPTGQLPRNAAGKILKRELRDQLTD